MVCWRTVCLSSLLAIMGAGMARAQSGPNASYAAVAGLGAEVPVQLRLTFVGPLQDEVQPAIILVMAGQTAANAKFQAFERPGVVYAPPAVKPIVQEVTAQEMKQIIQNLGGVEAVTNSSAASAPWLSVALLNIQGNQVSEAVLDKAQAAAAFKAIGDALADSNPQAFATINLLACSIGGLGPERPADVTASVTVKLSGVRLQRASGNFIGRLTLTNTGGAAIPGPISVAFSFSEPNIELAHKTGNTCAISPPGMVYINVDAAGGSIAAGASIDAVIEFSNPERHAIFPTFKVLAGPGPR